MKLDIREFFRATNPGKTLFVDNPEQDQKYYIDFSSVRGGQIIEDLKDNIALWSPDEPTCQLFTGHIGCGKSTELLRLKAELEKEGFHVVYYECQGLDMVDVDVGDVLFGIAHCVSESLDRLEKIEIAEPKGFKDILKGAAKLLGEIEISGELNLPGVGTAAASSKGKVSAELMGGVQVSADREAGLSLVAMGIGKITAKAKDSPSLRSKLRGYLEPRTNGILKAINQELLEQGIQKLKQRGKNGLVVIIDNLDRVAPTIKPWGRPQPEYLFVDRGTQLRSLHCHLVYTMPLALRFSNDYSTLTQRFMTDPKILPMVPVKLRDGSQHKEGMELLRKMVLARAFPDLSLEQRQLETQHPQESPYIREIVDCAETLDRLCCASGGHVRDLLRLLNESIKKERKLPLSLDTINSRIRAWCHELVLPITPNEWRLLRQVKETKQVAGDEGYQALIRSRFVYEYRDEEGSWFDINPILSEAPEF